MYRPHPATVLVLALLWIAIGSAVAATKIEHHDTRAAPIAAMLDLHGAQASLGRPAMNGFVLGLQQGSKHGLDNP